MGFQEEPQIFLSKIGNLKAVIDKSNITTELKMQIGWKYL